MRLSIAALTLLAPMLVHASGGVRTLTLERAVQQASFILVLERANPATETRTLKIPYKKDGKPRLAPMKTTFLRFKVVKQLHLSPASPTSTTGKSLLDGKEHTVQLAKAVAAGKVLRVIDSQTVTNHHVRVRYLRDGTRKIPLYRRLKVKANLEKSRRVIFLGGYNLSYQSLMGVGGPGLVPMARLKEIKRLLRKSR